MMRQHCIEVNLEIEEMVKGLFCRSGIDVPELSAIEIDKIRNAIFDTLELSEEKRHGIYPWDNDKLITP